MLTARGTIHFMNVQKKGGKMHDIHAVVRTNVYLFFFFLSCGSLFASLKM